MFNPIVAFLKHRNPFRSPVVTHRCAEGTNIEVRSPLRSARHWYSHHACDDNFAQAAPAVNLRFRDHVLTLFASDNCLSISHKAPNAYYRSEVRVTDMYRGGMIPGHMQWPGGAFYRYLEPIGIMITSAAHQERALAKYKAEHPAPAESA